MGHSSEEGTKRHGGAVSRLRAVSPLMPAMTIDATELVGSASAFPLPPTCASVRISVCACVCWRPTIPDTHACGQGKESTERQQETNKLFLCSFFLRTGKAHRPTTPTSTQRKDNKKRKRKRMEGKGTEREGRGRRSREGGDERLDQLHCAETLPL